MVLGFRHDRGQIAHLWCGRRLINGGGLCHHRWQVAHLRRLVHLLQHLRCRIRCHLRRSSHVLRRRHGVCGLAGSLLELGARDHAVVVCVQLLEHALRMRLRDVLRRRGLRRSSIGHVLRRGDRDMRLVLLGRRRTVNHGRQIRHLRLTLIGLGRPLDVLRRALDDLGRPLDVLRSTLDDLRRSRLVLPRRHGAGGLLELGARDDTVVVRVQLLEHALRLPLVDLGRPLDVLRRALDDLGRPLDVLRRALHGLRLLHVLGRPLDHLRRGLNNLGRQVAHGGRRRRRLVLRRRRAHDLGRRRVGVARGGHGHVLRRGDDDLRGGRSIVVYGPLCVWNAVARACGPDLHDRANIATKYWPPVGLRSQMLLLRACFS
mmetsp:Transcript_18109/g.63649  ORF Transcript_18109/g.63649 Transcript_18109/m.63649 type:complete len:374 (-) Transcript_18109:199-1320(-)